MQEEEDAEDILAEYSDSQPEPPSAQATETDLAAAPSRTQPPHLDTRQKKPTEPHSELRNRLFSNLPASSDSTSAHTTGSSTSAAPQQPGVSTTQLLESSTSAQNDLTTSLLDLAQKLKASSHSFSASLTADTEHLDRAVEGLDKNTAGLEAAGKRMGMLRRMSEGKGLWGRLMLYAWIAGLWVVAILLVGVGPKLRF